MNSYKFNALLSILPNLQNLDFHLIEVPDGKINRKEEKEMKQTFKLKKKSFSFDKKGMILKGIVSNDGQRVFVRAWDIYLNNKDIMSDEDVKYCFEDGIYEEWIYWISELESLNSKIHLSKLEYELLKYYIEHGYQYIARDEDRCLYAHKFKPCKIDNKEWYGEEDEWNNIQGDEYIAVMFENTFSFIKWEDEFPYYIPCMLDNCEVDENA